MNEREIKKMILAMAEVYGKQISEMALDIWVTMLKPYDSEILWAAFKQHLRESKFMPMPSDIISMVNPQPTTEQKAVETANKLVQALSMHGWANEDRASEFIGPVGWEVVRREGGWRSVCERTVNDDLPILKAQWRELAKAILAQNNRNSIAVLIEKSDMKHIENEASKILKGIP